MPVALISTSTSPALGPPNSTYSMVNGWPACQATAALVFMMSFDLLKKKQTAAALHTQVKT